MNNLFAGNRNISRNFPAIRAETCQMMSLAGVWSSGTPILTPVKIEPV